TFIGTDIGLRFKTTRGRGGVVENVYINNIFMKDIPGEAILFDMYYEAKDPIVLSGEHREPPKVEFLPVTEATPQFKDFYINNVVCDGAAKALFIRGLPEMHIKNIQLTRLDMVAKEGIDIQEASNISLRDVKLQVEDASKQIAYILNSNDIKLHQLEVKNANIFHLQGERTSTVDVQGLTGAQPVIKADFGANKNVININ